MSSYRLSVRGRAAGGAANLVPVEPLPGSGRPTFSKQVTVVVHGFNNSLRQAAWGYGVLDGDLRPQTTDIAWFFWPGDPSPVPFTSGVRFGSAVAAAEQAGGLLADFLQHGVAGATRPRPLRLVGHSLGCRVVLEAAAELAARGVTVSHTLLMGAAVPIGDCTSSGSQRFGATPLASRTEVLYSSADRALRRPFLLTQRRSSHRPELREAVGSSGLPRRRWIDPPVDTRLQHGSYLADEYCRERIRTVVVNPAPAAVRTGGVRTSDERRRELWLRRGRRRLEQVRTARVWRS